MKRYMALLLVSALMLTVGSATVAFATNPEMPSDGMSDSIGCLPCDHGPECDISTCERTCDNYVEKDVGVRVRIAPTICINTDSAMLRLGCLNPKTNRVGEGELTWWVKSNLPFFLTASWTDLTTDWWCRTTAPDGQVLRKRIQDKIAADRLKVSIKTGDYQWEVDKPSGWYGPTIGDADNHEWCGKLKMALKIDWCDSAGMYKGCLTLDAHQN